MKRPLKTQKPLVAVDAVIEIVKAAQAARDTFDTLRQGRHFSGPAYEKGYQRLRSACALFNIELLERAYSAQQRRGL